MKSVSVVGCLVHLSFYLCVYLRFYLIEDSIKRLPQRLLLLCLALSLGRNFSIFVSTADAYLLLRFKVLGMDSWSIRKVLVAVP